MKKLLLNIPFVRQFVNRINITDKRTDRDITEMRMAMVKLHNPEFTHEADYILDNLNDVYEWFVPYKKLKVLGQIENGIDKTVKLPYVIHNGRKLFFPKSYNQERCLEIYRSYIERECLLEWANFREKRPHQYESERCKIESGDVLVDVGCAEGLLVLDKIDVIKRAYLIEGNTEWIPALNATFHDYDKKVEIINKYVADKDGEETITLDSILKNDADSSIYIKMDIEGAEVGVISSNRDFICSRDQIKMAVCTYHKPEDAELLSALFGEMGMHQEYSEGYMYTYNGLEPMYPYFRHGLIRGFK